MIPKATNSHFRGTWKTPVTRLNAFHFHFSCFVGKFRARFDIFSREESRCPDGMVFMPLGSQKPSGSKPVAYRSSIKLTDCFVLRESNDSDTRLTFLRFNCIPGWGSNGLVSALRYCEFYRSRPGVGQLGTCYCNRPFPDSPADYVETYLNRLAT